MTEQATNRILKLGVIPAFAVWLLWFVLHDVKQSMDTFHAVLEAHAKESQSANQILIAIGRASCHIAANTPADHASCEVGR